MTPSITVVGVGALGSHVVQFLRGEALLNVIDFDRVEAKNVLSQFHAKSGIRQFKAAALYNTMNFLWGIKIGTNCNKLTAVNVDTLLAVPRDLIIDCLDNGAARRLVQNYVRLHNIPCLHGALAGDGSFGRVCWDSTFIIDDEDTTGAATCEDGAHLPMIAATAAHLARAAQRFLRHGKQDGFAISPSNVVSI